MSLMELMELPNTVYATRAIIELFKKQFYEEFERKIPADMDQDIRRFILEQEQVALEAMVGVDELDDYIRRQRRMSLAEWLESLLPNHVHWGVVRRRVEES
jgi:hypothetical protein